MPRRKKTATNDLPAFVDREKGAFQLSITPEQWDDLVATGVLPLPRPDFHLQCRDGSGEIFKPKCQERPDLVSQLDSLQPELSKTNQTHSWNE